MYHGIFGKLEQSPHWRSVPYRQQDSLYFSLLPGGEKFARDSSLRQAVTSFPFSAVSRGTINDDSVDSVLSCGSFAGGDRLGSLAWPVAPEMVR